MPVPTLGATTLPFFVDRLTKDVYAKGCPQREAEQQKRPDHSGQVAAPSLACLSALRGIPMDQANWSDAEDAHEPEAIAVVPTD